MNELEAAKSRKVGDTGAPVNMARATTAAKPQLSVDKMLAGRG